jgi:hypothetical protein
MNTTELKRKVLERLQVIAASEPVNTADGQIVLDKYEPLHSILLQDNLVEWAVSENIPEAYESVMVAMVAAECVHEFYCPPELKTAILSEGKYDLPVSVGGPSVAERRLRKLAAPAFNGEPVTADYY